MRDCKRIRKKYDMTCKIFCFVLLVLFLFLILGKENRTEKKQISKEKREQGYDLPIEKEKKTEVKKDCIRIMKSISGIYNKSEKENGEGKKIPDTTLEEMQKKIGENGSTVITAESYSRMENYEKTDRFLKRCMNDKTGSTVLYRVTSEGGVERKEYSFDGKNMYLLYTSARWGEEGEPVISDSTYARIRQWDYTEKGWFCYEVCVPEPPQVTEVIDGTDMIRILPLPEKNIEFSKKYVFPIGYQGNNLFCVEWDRNTLDQIDYNRIYPYFYGMKYGTSMNEGADRTRIPEKAFEDIIMEYLPVTAEQLRLWADYDEESRTYASYGTGIDIRKTSYISTSLPEVTDIQIEEDGIVVLTVEAVSGMIMYKDALLTHKLKIHMEEDGSFQYLENKLLSPDAQIR